ncbi:MAG: hypothetical protein R3F19_34415 [Verrucomicrobiales bacterium]
MPDPWPVWSDPALPACFFRRMRRPALIRAVIVMIALFSVGSVGMGLYLRVIPGDVSGQHIRRSLRRRGRDSTLETFSFSAGNRNQTFEVTPAETLLSPVDRCPTGMAPTT